MKKLFAFILIMAYGLSSSGMTVHFHYCCGKLDKISLEPVKGKCEGARSMKSKSCCDSKQVKLQLKGEQQHQKWVQHGFQVDALKPSYCCVLFAFSPLATKKLLPEVFAPPPLKKDYQSFFCIYLI